jgi:hypothetical protein
MAVLEINRRGFLSVMTRSAAALLAGWSGLAGKHFVAEASFGAGQEFERPAGTMERGRPEPMAPERAAPERLLETFIRRWCSRTVPVISAEIDQVEQHFGYVMPVDYSQSIAICGLPVPTIGILNTIVDNAIPMADVNDFHSPSEIVEMTEGWRPAGLPDTAIAFASDCMGNQFYFDRREGAASRIWLFDHDFETVRPVATNFSAWIKAFNDLPDALGED